MSGFSKMMLVVPTYLLTASLLQAGLGQTDLTKRLTEIDGKVVPMKMYEMEANKEFANRRVPLERWDTKFSPLGEKRAPIAVRETSEKNIRRPEIMEMDRVELKKSPMNGRRAYLRNLDSLQDKDLLPKYRDAEVVDVKDISRPALSPKGQKKEVSMRHVNRFSFQRNHSDAAGVKVDKAGSGESGKNE